jgi:signal peptidase I
MNENSTPGRRTLAPSETRDDLGHVPDGYSVARDPAAAGWQPQSQQPDMATTIEEAGAKAKPAKSAGRALREIVETILLAAVIFFGVRLLVLNFKVDGSSMTPNLQDKELLLVNRNAYSDIDLNRILSHIPGVDRDEPWVIWEFNPPERGDIVVFDPPNGDDKPYIKRVLALEGETVSIRNGSVFVDDIEIDEPYIRDGITECPNPSTCEWTVPDESVFVMGDNRRNSTDSRAFGPVPVDNIIGKALVTYWPSDHIGIVPHYDYPEISD